MGSELRSHTHTHTVNVHHLRAMAQVYHTKRLLNIDTKIGWHGVYEQANFHSRLDEPRWLCICRLRFMCIDGVATAAPVVKMNY